MSDNPNAKPMSPVVPPASGTIDITLLVEQIKNVWIKWATLIVVTAAKAVPYLAWLSFPIISQLFEFTIKLIVTAIANTIEMQSFFFNTAIRKSSQAQDFVYAVNAKNALPQTATDKEYEDAEKAQMVAFRNFVLVTN